MNGKDRLGGVNTEEMKKHSHNERINRRHDCRGLVGKKRAAKAVSGQQRPRHIALFPGVDVVDIHQVLEEETVEWNHSQAKKHRDQHHPDQDWDGAQSPANRHTHVVFSCLTHHNWLLETLGGFENHGKDT